MTTTTTEPAGQLAQPVRRAARYSVCAADGCTVIIKPGHPIVRIPGRGYAHRNCASGDAR
jgi:hypothetical protein